MDLQFHRMSQHLSHETFPRPREYERLLGGLPTYGSTPFRGLSDSQAATRLESKEASLRVLSLSTAVTGGRGRRAN